MTLRKRGAVSIPLNAMCDVAFLLLIFIMVVSLARYRNTIAIEYAATADDVPRVRAEHNCEITITKDGKLFIDGAAATLGSIEEKVVALSGAADDGETLIHISADKNTPFARVKAVLEMLQTLEWSAVSFTVSGTAAGEETP